MGWLLDLSNNSIQYGNFRKVFLLSKFKSICFVTILLISLKSRGGKNDHILFNVVTQSLEARNKRLVNNIPSIIAEYKFISENMPPKESLSLLNSVSNTTSFMYFRHFYIDS